jgi:hypothetical protein
MKKTYTLYRISPWSLMKIGFLVGWIASFLPVAFITALFFRLAAALAKWLGGLVYQVRLPIPGNFGFDINVVELLKLQHVLDQLQGWAVIGAIQIILFILLITTVIGLFWGFIAALVGLVFNLISYAIGGVDLTLKEEQISSELSPVVPVKGNQ